MVENQYQINEGNANQSVWSLYLYAMKSPVTRQKYQKRLEKFFDFLEMDGSTVEEKSKSFIKRIHREEENNNNSQAMFSEVLVTALLT